ncbi:nickel pincer cofactor biosynthesis protein LarC [Nocardioides solisilvae]|uniref:nickel pincer cofactor biosynthesis protein LarC n=1 Tax=Nocardioides solisilvae TaxID=1542435 RepID=UPI000D740D0B|nr:nickel pincer cofactor biosynthesis protein LarC [Nocardioides solisilvae]
MSGTAWVDASLSGASGDMLLGALVGAGVPVEVLAGAVTAASPEPVALRTETVRRGELAATRCHVEVADSVHHRTWRDVRSLLGEAALPGPVRELALRVFERLAVAEATVHGVDPADVAFHEVGALDAIADVVGVSAGFAWLREQRGVTRVVVSRVAVGSGTVRSAHGVLPVPPPAVAELLRGVPSWAGPETAPAAELCTPTGAALLTTLADVWGPQPPMTTDAIGVGAGGRDHGGPGGHGGHSNVVRLLLGAPEEEAATGGARVDRPPLLVETNVDDMDPRLWPRVIAALLAEGASDAWLTPILMKKGRPAHTLSVLVAADRAARVRAAIFRHTTTIGVREVPLGKHALEREMVSVEVDGQRIAVKLARHDGVLVNAQPEFDDVVRAAEALGRPVSEVLADAAAASRTFIPHHP